MQVRKPVQILALIILTLLVWRAGFYFYDQSMSAVLESTGTPTDSILLNPAKERLDTGELGTANDKIFHFAQVTDIHVSKFHTNGGLSHLEAFLFHELPLIAPDLVLCTGDIADSKAHHALTSIQHAEEWMAYYHVLKDSKVLYRKNSKFWWDQRGNHDCWNVPDFASNENWFRTYSAVKEEGYAFKIRKPYGTYSFVAVDGW
jgi:predicted phosphohydrolase